MARIRMDATQFRSVANAMHAFGPDLDDEMRQGLHDGLDWAKARARKLVRKKSRRLEKSIYTRISRRGKGWHGNLGANTPYARIREKGGTIQAKNGGYLVFPGRNGGLVMVRSVTQKATPYIKPAITQARPIIVQELRSGMERSRDKIAKAAR